MTNIIIEKILKLFIHEFVLKSPLIDITNKHFLFYLYYKFYRRS